MKLVMPGLALVAALNAAQAIADCQMPTGIASIPDGATATQEQLLAKQDEVRNYISAMDRYIACQNEELQTRGDDAGSEYLFQMAARIEAARSEVDAVATRFNDAVNAFRAAQPPARQAPLTPPGLQSNPLQQGPQQPGPQQQFPQQPQQIQQQFQQQPGLPQAR